MAIKFGDLLENQNTEYAVVDAHGNNVKGIIYATDLPGAADYPNKRVLGCLLVDTNSAKMYVYKGADTTNGNWGDSDNWEVFATGSGETIETNNLVVSIPSGTSFGRFENGATINVGASGKNAIDIIKDAITSYQAPTAAFDSAAQTAIGYDTVAQSGVSRTITFTVTNNNQAVISGSNYQISTVKLYRKQGSSGSYSLVASTDSSDSLAFTTSALSSINTQGSVSAGTFTFADSIDTSADDDDHFIYKIEVTPNDGDGSETTAVEVEGAAGNNGYVDIEAYAAPTTTSVSITRQNTSSHFVGTAESDTTREKGNIASKIEFKIVCNTSLVPITQFKIQRKIDSGSWTDIHTESSLTQSGTSSLYKFYDSVATTANNVTGQDSTPTGYTDTTAYPTGNISANSIQYRIQFTDDEQSTNTAALTTINLEFPALIGYSTTDGSGFSSSDDASMTTVLHAIRDTSADRRQYEIINTSGTGDPNFGAAITLAPSGTQFVYIAYPATYAEIDTFQKPNTPDEYGSFGSDPKSITVDFTTKYGIQNTAYEVYCSNSAGAFNGNYTIN